MTTLVSERWAAHGPLFAGNHGFFVELLRAHVHVGWLQVRDLPSGTERLLEHRTSAGSAGFETMKVARYVAWMTNKRDSKRKGGR